MEMEEQQANNLCALVLAQHSELETLWNHKAFLAKVGILVDICAYRGCLEGNVYVSKSAHPFLEIPCAGNTLLLTADLLWCDCHEEHFCHAHWHHRKCFQ